jgi:ABC-2 type transport system ATP-binding protein
MQVYLSARNVRKSYGNYQALSDVTLELYQGEILALLGPNGAGKTTLIKILATLLTKDGGQVSVMGYDLDRDEQEIRHLFGYVGQDTDRSAYARLTVVENLRFFGALRGLSRRQIDEQIEKLAHYFDFRANLDKLFMYLSGGQKQTVVIMRALLYDPPLIYLDEPTKGLDPLIAKKIRDFLQKYVSEERKSLLLTSHILTEVDELAHRVALIHGGKIAVSGVSSQLKAAVGAAHLIELRDEALPAEVRQAIQQLDQVTTQVERESGWASFGITDPQLGTEAVLRVLRESQIQVPFRFHTTTLEDAFVHHIGVLDEQFEK